MTRDVTIKIHAIAEDGLPDMADPSLVGRLAFLFDGNIVSGWPVAGEDADQDEEVEWEADSDVGRYSNFLGVTHWVEFPQPLFRLER